MLKISFSFSVCLPPQRKDGNQGTIPAVAMVVPQPVGGMGKPFGVPWQEASMAQGQISAGLTFQHQVLLPPKS